MRRAGNEASPVSIDELGEEARAVFENNIDEINKQALGLVPPVRQTPYGEGTASGFFPEQEFYMRKKLLVQLVKESPIGEAFRGLSENHPDRNRLAVLVTQRIIDIAGESGQKVSEKDVNDTMKLWEPVAEGVNE